MMPERFNQDFWSYCDRLLADSRLVIDREKDSEHHEWEGMIYPLDYGYLAGTTSSDGSGIDVFVGTSEDKRVVGILCTVDLIKKDAEIKILLACTEAEMRTVVDFLNDGDGMGCFFVRRPEDA
jgi:inorganic pyrophosphatase